MGQSLQTSQAGLSFAGGLFRGTSVRVVFAVLFILAAMLFFQRVPNVLRWPVRVLFLLAGVWLLLVLVQALRHARPTRRTALFTLALGAFLFGGIHLSCVVFVRLMGMKDDRLPAARPTQLTKSARTGIAATLDGQSPVQYDREIGWVHRPGYSWDGHTVSPQGLRGTRLYSEAPANPDKRILCLGDSFTFGYEVGDDETYPAHGERLAPGTEWINLGICGSGLTQSLLQYRKNGRRFGGKHVIIGFMTNNQKRTVNAFRPLVDPTGSMTPLAKPFARITNGVLSIEPNPFQDITDYERLLADEPAALQSLLQQDYTTWSGQGHCAHPVARTIRYIRESREVDRNVALLLNRDLSKKRALSARADPYGRSIWHPDSLAFQANAAVFELLCQEIEADGRIPLVVILPGLKDLEDRAAKRSADHSAKLAFLKSAGLRHFDFMDTLERLHPGELRKEKFFVRTHLNSYANELLAREIIDVLALR